MANFRTIGTNFTGGARAPFYTNGRLLTAEDLQQEQEYQVERHAQLGKAAGYGIVEGFNVSAVSQNKALTITDGLGLNRQGDIVHLAAATVTLPIEPITPEAASLARSGRFEGCDSANPDQPASLADSAYLLTARPVAHFEGSVPRRACDGTNTSTCANQWEVEGVEFRIIRLAGFKPPTGSQANRNRNLLAHWFYGSDQIVDLMLDPLEFPADYSGFNGIAAEDFNDCDLPLAVFYWAGSKVSFVDEWSVRRRLMHPYPADNWASNLSDQRTAEGQARYLQFQRHLADLQTQFGSKTGSVRAVDRFAYLPPVGILPVNPFELITVDVFANNISREQLRQIVERELQLTDVFNQVQTGVLQTYAVGNAFSLENFFGPLLPDQYLVVHEDLIHDRLHQSWVQPPIQLPPPPKSSGGFFEIVQLSGLQMTADLDNFDKILDNINNKFAGSFYTPHAAAHTVRDSVRPRATSSGEPVAGDLVPSAAEPAGSAPGFATEFNTTMGIGIARNRAEFANVRFHREHSILRSPMDIFVSPQRGKDGEEEAEPLLEIMVVRQLLDPYVNQLEKEISARIDDAITALSGGGAILGGNNRYKQFTETLANSYARHKYLMKGANYGTIHEAELLRLINKSSPPAFYVVFARHQPQPVPRPLRLQLKDFEER